MPLMDWRDEQALLDEYAEDLAYFADYVNSLNKKEFRMDSLNKVSLEGFVGCEPKVFAFEDGNKVAHLSLGLVRYFSKDESIERKISFIPIDVYNPEMTFKKGDELHVDGILRTDSWKDENDMWRSKVKVIAKSISYR